MGKPAQKGKDSGSVVGKWKYELGSSVGPWVITKQAFIEDSYPCYFANNGQRCRWIPEWELDAYIKPGTSV